MVTMVIKLLEWRDIRLSQITNWKFQMTGYVIYQQKPAGKSMVM